MGTAAIILVFACVLLRDTEAFQWSPELPNGTALYVCTGRDVNLTWAYTLAAGDVVTSTTWAFDGRSQEMIAAYTRGHFLPTPSFANRVQHIPEAGLSVKQMTIEDSGTYRVRVVGHSDSGTSFIHESYVTINVSESLQLTEGGLRVRQQVTNSSNSAYAVVLTCGRFLETVLPPFQVEWLLPSGRVISSDFFSDGFFHLILDNDVEEGNYTCQIPDELFCVKHEEVRASVFVDALRIRMSLMEWKMEHLQEENLRLKQDLASLQGGHDVLKTQVAHLQNNWTEQALYKQVAFQAMMKSPSDPWSNNRVNFQEVLVNYGGAYNATTGRFTAPLDGLFYFSVLTTPGMMGRAANFRLMANDDLSVNLNGTISKCSTYNNASNFQSTACHGLLHLRKGQQVWLEEFGDGYYMPMAGSGFNGFLIAADP